MIRSLVQILVLVLLPQCNERPVLSGTVVKVADGDTFTIVTDQKKQFRIRLHGIDAPEKGQDFYRASAERLADLVMHKRVRIIETKRDRYGRIVGIVFRDDVNVNETMLANGLAWHYKEYDSNSKWSELERQAKSGKAGIWLHNNPTPPWEYRKMKRIKRPAN